MEGPEVAHEGKDNLQWLIMRRWNRSACNLGSKALEDAIQQGLTLRFPFNQFPANIDVVGNQHTDCPTVQITNFDADIKVFEMAAPQVGWNTDELLLRSVIAIAERTMSELVNLGRLPQL